MNRKESKRTFTENLQMPDTFHTHPHQIPKATSKAGVTVATEGLRRLGLQEVICTHSLVTKGWSQLEEEATPQCGLDSLGSKST